MTSIVVADDRIDVVEGLEEMLSPYYEVDTARSGLEVLRLFKKRAYTGLILDVNFETGMNGLEIASRLRTRYKDLKIIIFSATDYSETNRQQATDLGAIFCEKPLKLETIRDIMEA